MDPVSVPLTLSVALTTFHLDIGAAALVVVACFAYCWALRRCDVKNRRYLWWFAIGIALVIAATMSAVAIYATVLFWVRALQVLILLYVAPFFLAMARPVTVVTHGFGITDRTQRLLATAPSRVVLHPATTSAAMLATPWLLYLTPWYTTALRHEAVGYATDAMLLAIGFVYFYARLQTDPVPRRYTQLISLVISIVESLGDGLLGIVLWLGPLIAVDYYTHIGRQWGPSMRVDQSIGAGVLWILGDVLGVGFIVVLMRLFAADEKGHALVVDAELDRAESETAADTAAGSGLWWESDPQMRDRIRRR
jgi:cytochrome c oxidase assembly factor CtaG